MSAETRVGKRAEQKRRWDRDNRDHCACGAIKWRKHERCRSCEDERRVGLALERRREVQRRWLEGQTLIEIASAMDTTVNALATLMVHMRQAGWDLPYRRRPKTHA